MAAKIKFLVEANNAHKEISKLKQRNDGSSQSGSKKSHYLRKT